MAGIDGDRVIQILSQKLAESVAREAIQQAYNEQLEKQLEEANGGLAQKYYEKTSRQADGVETPE